MKRQEQIQKLPPSAGYFSLLAQRKVTKRKGLSPTELTGLIGLDGIFRQDIPVLSKNGWHPCQPPSGSAGRINTLLLREERLFRVVRKFMSSQRQSIT
jgi:hypothetical protein